MFCRLSTGSEYLASGTRTRLPRQASRAEPRKSGPFPEGDVLQRSPGLPVIRLPWVHPAPSEFSVERTGPRTPTDVAETEAETTRNRGDRVSVRVMCHWQSMPCGEVPTIQRSIGCGLGGPMSVDGPMRSTAGASCGTVTGGSRSTGYRQPPAARQQNPFGVHRAMRFPIH
jgi:hypothetical protein